jgi:hypothetical protein
MSIPQGQRATAIGAAIANAVRTHSTLFIAEGIILVLLGALAIFVPLFATITVTIILGAETLSTIAADPKHLGARIGITSVLHSWAPHSRIIPTST